MDGALEKYGLAGIVIFGMAYFIMWLMKDNKKERKENAERMERMNDKNVEAINNNTDVLSSMKTLLENQNRNGK